MIDFELPTISLMICDIRTLAAACDESIMQQTATRHIGISWDRAAPKRHC